MEKELLNASFNFLNAFSKNDYDEFVENIFEVFYEKGQLVHSGSFDCNGVILVKSGTLRAYLLSEEGKDNSLYFLKRGDTCILSASCVLFSSKLDIQVEAFEECKCYILDISYFNKLAATYPEVEIFGLRVANLRFVDLLNNIYEYSFKNLDTRLRNHLLNSGNDEIYITHEVIASRLNSSREVITRALKRLAKNGIIEQKRGYIKILDRNKLENLRN